MLCTDNNVQVWHPLLGVGTVLCRMVDRLLFKDMYATYEKPGSFSNRKKNSDSGLSQFITNLGVKPLKKTFHRSTKNQLRVLEVHPVFKKCSKKGSEMLQQ